MQMNYSILTSECPVSFLLGGSNVKIVSFKEPLTQDLGFQFAPDHKKLLFNVDVL